MRTIERFSTTQSISTAAHGIGLAGFILLLSLTLGCAGQPTAPPQAAPGEPEPTVVSYPEYKDPLIGVNRAIFSFNDVTYRYAMIPIAKGYNWLFPDPLRTGIGNVFHNIKMPIRSVNYLLQLKPREAGVGLLRFVINSTVGLLGIFDPAEAWFELERSDNGFEDTLSRYGSGYGTYIVLPFFGPSDLRNGGGRLMDYALHPIPYITDQPETSVIMAADALQEFAPTAEQYETLRARSDDPYLFFRNLYLQRVQRDADHQQTEIQQQNKQAQCETTPC